MKKLTILLFSILISINSFAGYKEGNDAFREGDHKTAIFHFEKALEEDPELDLVGTLGLLYRISAEDIDSDYKKTFQYFLKAATGGPDTHTRYILAMLYLTGKGTEIDLDKAHHWLLRSIEHVENGYSLWLLGKNYLHGLGVDKDYTKALEYFVRADKQDNANAQFELGHLYEYGKGVEKNIPKALEYYQKGYKQGDSESKYKIDILTGKLDDSERDHDFDLALDYTYGYTLPRDYFKAIEYYRKGADKGHAPSIYNLAFLIERTSRTKQNSLVSKYFLQAAELGYLYAQQEISHRYFLGNGVERSNEKSFYWENKAAEQENIESIFEIAESYRLGSGVEKNFEKAIEQYLKSSKLGHSQSFYRLAQMHEDGEGVDENFEQALEYYTIAAEDGYDKAQNQLAEFYFEGEKVEKNVDTAYYWAKKAADQDYADAQNKMGVLYDQGIVVEQDKQKALDWYNKAAEQGNVKAFNNLGDFYSMNEGIKSDLKKGFNWYMKAAKLDDAESQLEVGLFYELGLAVEEDKLKAIEWYEKAAGNKLRGAQMRLGSLYYYGFKDSDEIEIDYKESANWYYRAAKNEKNEGKTSVRISKSVSGSGSGFFVTPNHIITNNHVTDRCDELSVNNKVYKSKVTLFDTDENTDLSILITGKPSQHFLSFRDRKPVTTGEQSITLGYPFSSSLGSNIKVTTGNVAALTGFRNNIAELQLTSPVQPGNSGGPLLDHNGNVIGVIVSRLEKSREITGDRPAQNVNFAIKSNMVKIFMDLNRIDYVERKANGSKSVSEIVKESENATVKVVCYEND